MTLYRTSIPASPSTTASIRGLFHFIRLMTRASLRDWRSTGILLFIPLLMLIVFSFSSSDLLPSVLPGIAAMAAFFAGAPFATKMAVWRERGVFRRLACTPTPVGRLVLSYGLIYAVIALLQSALTLFAAGTLFHVDFNAFGAVLASPIFLLTAICFTAYGALMVGLVNKTETINVVYVFTLFPMMFISPIFTPNSAMPNWLQTVGEWTPPALAVALTRPLLATGRFPSQAPLFIIALTGYALVFAFLAAFLLQKRLR